MLKLLATRLWVAIALVATSGCAREPVEESSVVEEVADSVDALSPATLASLPAGADSAAIEVGREAFLVCAVCHGLDGNGTPLGPSLRDTSWIHISGAPNEIAAIIQTGVAEPAEHPLPMPVMGGGQFTRDELNGLVAYVHALSRS
jgi:mono/diheme cytochrome c family protein